MLPLGGLHGEPEEVRDLGDTVLARHRRDVSPEGGRGAPDDLAMVRYRDGKSTWWQFFRTEEEALEAAGLSE